MVDTYDTLIDCLRDGCKVKLKWGEQPVPIAEQLLQGGSLSYARKLQEVFTAEGFTDYAYSGHGMSDRIVLSARRGHELVALNLGRGPVPERSDSPFMVSVLDSGEVTMAKLKASYEVLEYMEPLNRLMARTDDRQKKVGYFRKVHELIHQLQEDGKCFTDCGLDNLGMNSSGQLKILDRGALGTPEGQEMGRLYDQSITWLKSELKEHGIEEDEVFSGSTTTPPGMQSPQKSDSKNFGKR